MRFVIAILLLFTACHVSVAQHYYLRGEIKDESGNTLQNVTILHNRTGYIYKSGSAGTFGINLSQQVDTFTFSLSGYNQEMVQVDANKYLSLKLQRSSSSLSTVKINRLQSFTRGMAKEDHRKWFSGDETYASLVENQFVNANQYPNTGMALNVDRASYSNVRRFLNLNSIVPSDAVRIEEMLNYFNLDYQEPQAGKMFAVKTQLTSNPWNKNNQLFFVNLSAKKLDMDSLPASNLVFLVDVSGSMEMTNRLPLLKSAFRLLVNNLREKDTVSIVVYGGGTGIMLHPTSGADKENILRTIDGLTAGGSTPGESGVKLAYDVARRHFIHGGNNRVILATDGDFNVGLRTENELDELITRHRESGIYLTCLGVGMGNYKDSKIQTLARKGNGNFAYIDNFAEGEKVLLKEFTQTLYAVADDAYMNVDFNPDYVKEYRLIGFDNKVGALNDSVALIEGGEIGSGYSMMGIFEIVPVKRSEVINHTEKFAQVKINYKNPGASDIREFVYTSHNTFTALESLPSCYRFATAVAMLGGILKESSFMENSSWNELLVQATLAANMDDPLQHEFVQLVQQGKTLYAKVKKKKKNKQGR